MFDQNLIVGLIVVAVVVPVAVVVGRLRLAMFAQEVILIRNRVFVV